MTLPSGVSPNPFRGEVPKKADKPATQTPANPSNPGNVTARPPGSAPGANGGASPATRPDGGSSVAPAPKSGSGTGIDVGYWLKQGKGLLASEPAKPSEQPKDLKAATVAGKKGDVHQTADGRERVYVLHSGLNDPTNTGAAGVRDGLLANGIPDERILILNNRYPSFNERNGFFRNLWQYDSFGSKDSKDGTEVYGEMQEAIKGRGFKPDGVAVTLVGHSGGGQASLALAEVDKGKDKPVVDRVVTLGSPIMRNRADAKVALTHITSDEDPIVTLATGSIARGGGLLLFGGSPAQIPANLDDNDQVVKVTNLDHHGYFKHKPTMKMVSEAVIGRPLTGVTGEGRDKKANGPKERPSMLQSLMTHFMSG